MAGPEEASQAVTASSRHDVHVQVRDALTDHVVVGDEGALAPESLGHRSHEPLNGGHQRRDRLRHQLVERHHVVSRHDERVTGEQRCVVEERHRVLILEHHVGAGITGHDPAEDAAVTARSGTHVGPLSPVR